MDVQEELNMLQTHRGVSVDRYFTATSDTVIELQLFCIIFAKSWSNCVGFYFYFQCNKII